METWRRGSQCQRLKRRLASAGRPERWGPTGDPSRTSRRVASSARAGPAPRHVGAAVGSWRLRPGGTARLWLTTAIAWSVGPRTVAGRGVGLGGHAGGVPPPVRRRSPVIASNQSCRAAAGRASARESGSQRVEPPLQLGQGHVGRPFRMNPAAGRTRQSGRPVRAATGLRLPRRRAPRLIPRRAPPTGVARSNREVGRTVRSVPKVRRAAAYSPLQLELPNSARAPRGESPPQRAVRPPRARRRHAAPSGPTRAPGRRRGCSAAGPAVRMRLRLQGRSHSASAGRAGGEPSKPLRSRADSGSRVAPTVERQVSSSTSASLRRGGRARPRSCERARRRR
jgi:hypothetical protein